MSVYEGIMKGLEEALKHAQGRLALRSSDDSFVPTASDSPGSAHNMTRHEKVRSLPDWFQAPLKMSRVRKTEWDTSEDAGWSFMEAMQNAPRFSGRYHNHR